MEGSRIKCLREEQKLKQEELAKILSISPSAVGMYERNEREPNDELTLKIAKYFDVSTDYLLGNSDIRNPQKIKIIYDKKFKNFVTNYNKLNSIGKAKINENIKDLMKIDEYIKKE